MAKRVTTILVIGLSLLAVLCNPENGQAQFMRQVVIYQDTVIEFQKRGTDDPNIPYGIDIQMWDSTEKTLIEFIKTVKNNDLHGDAYMFDHFTGLPMNKEHYENGLQDGLSYYWNKEGELIRTERWEKGKLISRRIHRK